MRFYFCLFIVLSFTSCKELAQGQSQSLQQKSKEKNTSLIDETGNTIENRFLAPDNYIVIDNPINSFAHYLKNLPLKPANAPVKLYDGSLKSSQSVHLGVIDLPIGSKDLHQCADAIMRLRAEYLLDQNLTDQIVFNFTNGFPVPYSKWIEGYRVQVKGNKCSWTKAGTPGHSDEKFWAYLEQIFMYAGTASLEKELKSKSKEDLEVGDVFIQGGHPGHAIIVVDRAKDMETGEVIFMLAQSYMPAQELHVLKNPVNGTAWYRVSDNNITTPEWNFYWKDLKSFE